MNLKVNGEMRDVENVRNIQRLLAHFKIDHKILVVELNKVIIDRKRYEETALNDGDQIEIVHFVGGG